MDQLKNALTDRQGSMLIVCLMVLLTLGAVAAPMVRKVNDEVRFSGNVRKGTTAFHVTESGAFTSLAYADSLGPAGFLSVLESQIEESGVEAPTWQAWEMVPNVDFFDMSAEGSFGYEGYMQNTAVADSAANPNPGFGTPDDDGTAAAGPVSFSVQVTPAGMVQPLVGYQMTGQSARCRFKYQFDSDGKITNPVGDMPDDAEFNAWKRTRAMMYVGPLPCDKTVGQPGQG